MQKSYISDDKKVRKKQKYFFELKKNILFQKFDFSVCWKFTTYISVYLSSRIKRKVFIRIRIT